MRPENFPEKTFLDGIESGKTETKLFKELGITKDRYKLHVATHPKFREALDAAYKARADKWFDHIADEANIIHGKDDAAGAKLQFEKYKYLASVDNPEKYSEKVRHELGININLFQEIKNLPKSEVKKMIESSDPFIEADFEVVERDENYEDVL